LSFIVMWPHCGIQIFSPRRLEGCECQQQQRKRRVPDAKLGCSSVVCWRPCWQPPVQPHLSYSSTPNALGNQCQPSFISFSPSCGIVHCNWAVVAQGCAHRASISSHTLSHPFVWRGLAWVARMVQQVTQVSIANYPDQVATEQVHGQ